MSIFRRNREQQPGAGSDFAQASMYKDLAEPVIRGLDPEGHHQEVDRLRDELTAAPSPIAEVNSRLRADPEKTKDEVVADLNAQWKADGVNVFSTSWSEKGSEICGVCGTVCSDSHYAFTQLPPGEFDFVMNPDPDQRVNLAVPEGGFGLAEVYGFVIPDPEAKRKITTVETTEVELHALKEHPSKEQLAKKAYLEEILRQPDAP